MNEQLQNALAEILGKTLNGLESATDFVAAELPDVIQQLLTWYAVKGFIFFVISVCVLLSPILIFKIYYKVMDGDEYCYPFTFITSLIPILIGVFTVNLDWLKIWIAPKIWLIEYAASLAK